jgi:hypothetical protein
LQYEQENLVTWVSIGNSEIKRSKERWTKKKRCPLCNKEENDKKNVGMINGYT